MLKSAALGLGVLALLAVALGWDSQDTRAPEELWTKAFGTPNAPELAKKVRQTSDGGYILVGGATRPGSGRSLKKREIPRPGASQPGSSHYAYLIKTDPSGNLQWEKTLADGTSDWGFDVQQTQDGGYIIAGADNGSGGDHDDRDFSRNSDVYLIKTDTFGNVQWEKKFGGDRADKALRVQKTADGGYILIGVTAPSGDKPWDVYLLKTDASGNLQWQKTFGTKGEDWGQAVVQTADGGYILAGQIQVGEKKIPQREEPVPIFNVYVVRTDSSGNLIWEKSFGGEENNAKGRAIKITPDGNYMIAGDIATPGKPNDFYLLKIDTEGNMLWEKRFGVPVSSENLWDLDGTADGGYILAGETMKGGIGGHDLDVYVVRTDADGNVLWTKVIGTPGDPYSDWARGVQQTSDGGYILAGMTTSADGDKDAYLIKLSSDLRLRSVRRRLGRGSSRQPSDPTQSEIWVLKGYSVGKNAGNESSNTRGVLMPEVILLDNGTYRMYYGASLRDGTTAIKYAESFDGVTWTVKGTALQGATYRNDPEARISGPSVLKLSNGKYRMYYQSTPEVKANETVKFHIRSAISDDGITFTRESGVRINNNFYDPSSMLRIAGHGTFYYASDNTTIVAIFSGEFTSDPPGHSDLKYAISTDGGTTFGNFKTLYDNWHDPIVIKLKGGGYKMYATYLFEKHGMAYSSDGLNWPSSPTVVSFVDSNGTVLTPETNGVGDIGGVLLTTDVIRLYTNYFSSQRFSEDIVYFDRR